MQILDGVSSKLLLPSEERRRLWCKSTPTWALGCPHRSFMNYIILGGAVYMKRGRFARKGQMAMVLSLFSFMWWEHLPKLWETTTITTIWMERVVSWKVKNWQHFKAMLLMVCFFPTAKFQSSLVSMFFFPIIICACLFVITYKMKPLGYIDVEMLPNGVWQYEIYDTRTSQLSDLGKLVRNLDLEGKMIPRCVKKAICHSNISLKTLFIDLFFLKPDHLEQDDKQLEINRWKRFYVCIILLSPYLMKRFSFTFPFSALISVFFGTLFSLSPHPVFFFFWNLSPTRLLSPTYPIHPYLSTYLQISI